MHTVDPLLLGCEPALGHDPPPEVSGDDKARTGQSAQQGHHIDGESRVKGVVVLLQGAAVAVTRAPCRLSSLT